MKKEFSVASIAMGFLLLSAGVAAQEDPIFKLYPDMMFNIESETGAYTEQAGVSIDAGAQGAEWRILQYQAALAADSICCEEDEELKALNNNDVGAGTASDGRYAKIPLGSEVLTLSFPGPVADIDGLAIYAGYEDRLPRKFTVRDDLGNIVGVFKVPDLRSMPEKYPTRMSLLVHFERRIYTTKLIFDVERSAGLSEPVSVREIRVYNNPAKKNLAFISTVEVADPSKIHFLSYEDFESGKSSIRASLGVSEASELPSFGIGPNVVYSKSILSNRSQMGAWYVDYVAGTIRYINLSDGSENGCLTDGTVSPYIANTAHPQYGLLYEAKCTNLKKAPFPWFAIEASQKFQFPMRDDGNGVMRPMIQDSLGRCLWSVTSETELDGYSPLTYISRDIACDAKVEEGSGAYPLFLIFQGHHSDGRKFQGAPH